ncbi:MAG: DUF4178 domain-containing protein [Opitutaceae bacterium]|nr:DUF4178 domain-containing protein [Opitutaceae bacterium]
MSASHENPTALRLGATGTLNGWRVRVAGRVVLAVEIEGEDYFWNEFRLVDGSGNEATLVFEEGEAGPEWKLFRPFTPMRAMTAAEAAGKRVGEKVNLDGTPVAITLVDESRVVQIEGEGPEGVEVGDIAHYFNADTGDRMLVASWTDDEIEFYEGLDVPGPVVEQSFNLPKGRSAVVSNFSDSSGLREPVAAKAGIGWVPKLVLVALGAIVVFSGYSCFARKSAAAPAHAVRPFAPTLQLINGAEGALAAQPFSVTAQSAVEIATPAGRHHRREYALRSATGEPALLINGLSGGSKEWHLLRLIPPLAHLPPLEAARRKISQPVAIEGRTFKIIEVFQSKTLFTEPARSGPAANALEYGFLATEGAEVLLARWNETKIQFWRGTTVNEAAVSTAFTQPRK